MQVEIKVKPGSKKGPLVQPSLTGELLIYVKEPAVGGQANQAVIELLADYYNLAKSQIEIIHGRKSKTKIFQINK